MAGVRLIATRRFAVYGNAGESGLGDGPALEQSSSSSTSINNNSRSGRAPYGAAGGASAMAYEKDGGEIEVPTMRLRELNKSNASRCVHIGCRCCCSGLALHLSVRPLLPLATGCRSIDSMVDGQENTRNAMSMLVASLRVRIAAMLHILVPGT